MVEVAHAKVNLHLEVFGERSDGYHDIQSVMASVKFGDKFKVLRCCKSKSAKLDLKVTGSMASLFDELDPKDNLIYKAFDLFFENNSDKAYVELLIEKVIPSGAGLGGGSSDAAAVLRVLNRVFRSYSRRELDRLASRLGSDVPFCLQKSIALCEGRGELVKPFSGIQLKLFVVIIFSNVFVSTKEAYSLLGKNKNEKRPRGFFKKKLTSEGYNVFCNSFESVVLEQFSELKNKKKICFEFKPEFVSLTGSGSAIVAYFKDRVSAKKLADYLFQNGYSSVLTEII